MDTKEIQQHLIRLGLLDPPADGKWGKYSDQALGDFKKIYSLQESDLAETTIPWSLGNDFASRLIKYMLQNQYFIAVGANRFNIIYIEGVDGDGKLNPDRPNEFNDRRIVVEVLSGIPRIVGNWLATTEPGKHYTVSPMNPKGAARIKFGQYKSWQVGMHGNSDRHEALVQVCPITVHRDRNKDFKRTGDALDTGLFAVNQHWGYDLPKENIGNASAGCLVGQSRNGHREFMGLIKQDVRYQLAKNYIFFTTIIAGDVI